MLDKTHRKVINPSARIVNEKVVPLSAEKGYYFM